MHLLKLLDHFASPNFVIITTLVTILNCLVLTYFCFKILFKIDDLLAEKFNNKNYIRRSISFCMLQIKRVLKLVIEAMKLPNDISPMHFKMPLSMTRFGHYHETIAWFYGTMFMLGYWLLLIVLLTSTIGDIPIYKSILAFIFQFIFLVCSRFFYVEGRKSLSKARTLSL